MSTFLLALAWALAHSVWAIALFALLVQLTLSVAPTRAAGASNARYVITTLGLLGIPLGFFAATAHAWARLHASRTAEWHATEMHAMARSELASGAQVVALVWGAVAALLLVRSAATYARVSRELARDITLLDEAWHARVRRGAEALGVAPWVIARLRVAIVSDDRSPCVSGFLRPLIVLPVAAITSLPVEYLEAVLLHELSHIRRWDVVVGALEGAVKCLFFYHPAVYWLASRARAEREYAADADAAAVLGDRMTVARALLAFEELRLQQPVMSTAFNGGSLMNRVRSLLAPSSGSIRTSPSPRVFVVATAAVIATMVACHVASAPAEEGSSTTPSHVMADVTHAMGDKFESAARTHGVSARLLAAVATVESRGDARAESRAGARGVMQIMPKTGEAIARERGLESFTTDALWEADRNIDFGAYYLARQISEFGPNDGLAAYNAGPEAVRAHRATGTPLPDETRAYVVAVNALLQN